MKEDKIEKLLERQLELLSEQSECLAPEGSTISEMSHAMVEIAIYLNR